MLLEACSAQFTAFILCFLSPFPSFFGRGVATVAPGWCYFTSLWQSYKACMIP